MIEFRRDDRPGYDWVRGAYNAFDYGQLEQLDSLYYWIFDLLKIEQGRRLIDVACGKSQLVRLATEKGLQAVGVDFAYAPLRALRQSGAGHYVTADGQSLPFGDRQFDYLTSIGSLEHYENMNRGLQEMARLIKPGGKIIILVPNTFSILHNVYLAFKTGLPLDDGQPVQRVGSILQWKQLIANHLDIQDTFKYEREWPVVWKDFIWYLQHPKKLVYLLLTPFIPTNLGLCFVFLCIRKAE